MATSLELLRQLNLGNSVAEFDERLKHYFVKTQLFLKVSSDQADIIKGDKGTGKSAIYRALKDSDPSLDTANLDIVPGFNESGAPIFRRIIDLKNKDEANMRSMWKIHVLAIAANVLHDKNPNHHDNDLTNVISALVANGLRQPDGTIAEIWQKVREFIARAEFSYKANGAEAKVFFSRSDSDLLALEYQIDDMLAKLDRYLSGKQRRMWILFDRLDESFASSPSIEIPALRALCRVYLDLQNLQNIKLKLFFRQDLFRKVARDGFVNLSHLEARSVNLDGISEDLHALLCARIRQNDSLMSQLGVDKRTSDKTLFDKIFPDQVDSGDRKPTTWNWILARIEDGNGVRAPRNIIDLINLAKEAQISKEQRSVKQQSRKSALIEPDSLKLALDRLSDKRVNGTLIAEAGDLSKVMTLPLVGYPV